MIARIITDDGHEWSVCTVVYGFGGDIDATDQGCGATLPRNVGKDFAPFSAYGVVRLSVTEKFVSYRPSASMLPCMVLRVVLGTWRRYVLLWCVVLDPSTCP